MEVQTNDGTAVIAMEKELDFVKDWHVLDATIADQEVQNIILDFELTSYVNSSAAGYIAKTACEASEANKTFRAVNVGAEAKIVFECLGIHKLMQIETK